MRRFVAFILLLGTSVMLNIGHAQCAMCRAVGESNTKTEGTSFADGLNNGILWLMIFPYILLFFFFRKKIVKFFKELGSMRD